MPARALGEAVGQVLERIGPAPDAAVLAVSAGHAGALEDMAAAMTEMLSPAALIGAAAHAVIGPAASLGPGPALCLWAARGGAAAAWSISAEPAEWRGDHAAPWGLTGARLVLASTAFPLSAWLGRTSWTGGTESAYPKAAVVARLGAPGGAPATLVAGDQSFRGGAVGLGFDPRWGVTARVATGWRGVGPSLRVTRGERDVVYELDGRPAMARLRTVVRDQIPASDGQLLYLGLGLGPDAPGPEAPPVRTVLGSDPDNGALALSGPLPEGRPAQFQVVDPAVAAARLRRALAGAPAALVLASGQLGDAGVAGDDAVSGPRAGMVAEELVVPHAGRPERFGEGAVVLRFGSVPPRG